jgi:hypothetical protein
MTWQSAILANSALLSGGNINGCLPHLPERVLITPTNVMDDEQSTVAGAPNQYVTLPSGSCACRRKNVCEENRGITPLILKPGTRASRLGSFTLAITKRYVRRGKENPHVFRLAPSVAVDPRSWFVGVREISFVFVSYENKILYGLFDTKCLCGSWQSSVYRWEIRELAWGVAELG